MTEASGKARAEESDRAVVVRLNRGTVDYARVLLSLLARGHKRILFEIESDAGLAAGATKTEFLRQEALDILANRRRRHEIFGKGMFGEPAWDMLLILFTEASQARLSVNRLVDLSGARKTTALRWLDYLESQKLVQYDSHPTDRRKFFVELTDEGREAIELYISGTLTFDV